MRLPAAALLALALACPALADPVTVTDSLGREVTVPAPAQRVVAIYNEAFGHMATLGVRPVATHVNLEMALDSAYYFADGTAIPSVGAADDTGDPELVAAFRPDLIIGWSGSEAEAMATIAPFYGLESVRSPADIDKALRDIAALLGVPDRAEAAIAAFDARTRAYAALVPERPSVLMLGASGGDAFWLSTQGDPACVLLDGIVSCPWPAVESQPWGYEGTTEAVLALDPDVIFLSNWTGEDAAALAAALAANPLWREIRAVRDGRVVSVPGYDNPIFSSLASGKKLMDTLIPALFPETFPAPLTDAQVAAALQE